MANWPVNPTWVDPSTINDGQKFNAGDGVKASDMNIMIEDLINLKNSAPSGTYSISANGEYDIRQYQKVNVAVAGSRLQEKTITTNGTHTPDSGYDGFSKVVVNVPAASQPKLYAPTISITSSGNVLTITRNNANGYFGDSFDVYCDDVLLVNVDSDVGSSTVVLLSFYPIAAGTHTIYAKSVGTNFNDSDASNSVTITVAYWQTPTITLSGNIVSTSIVAGVTKYKVYDRGTYIGYVDSNGTWHSA